MLRDSLLQDRDARVVVALLLDRLFNGLEPLAEKINPPADASEGDHESDEQNKGVDDRLIQASPINVVVTAGAPYDFQPFIVDHATSGQARFRRSRRLAGPICYRLNVLFPK
jgi:hypothetical protein